MGKAEASEAKIYGRNACLALFRARRDDLIRVYLTEERVNEFSKILHWCSQRKLAYHIVSLSELEKVSGSEHHESVCFLVKRKQTESFASFFLELSKLKDPSRACLLYLDGVKNPHNFGTLLRVGAHFGIGALIGKKAELPSLSGAACRTAEGGAELVRIVTSFDALDDLQALRSIGYKVIATSSHAQKSIFEFSFPRNTVFLIGSETHGISKELEAHVDAVVTIPGTGEIESLNVGTATAVILAEYTRQHSLKQQFSKKENQPKHSRRGSQHSDKKNAKPETQKAHEKANNHRLSRARKPRR